MIVTIGIKALNEEANIAACLTSALQAAKCLGGEVILADSGSTDRTIAVARDFPIHIVQLADSSERCCGAGAQLAFQHATGDYFYLLDGDMTIHPDFLEAGIAYLEANTHVAGVGGRVSERNLEGQDFKIRARTAKIELRWHPGTVDRLDCGGLYRTEVIRQVGYFADRNLHSFEEFDLACRLRSQGWELARIDHAAVNHYGHTAGGYHLLWRRLRSGYAGGVGEVLRAALGRKHLYIVLRGLVHVRYGFAVMCWWLLLLVATISSPGIIPFLIAIPLLFLSFRRKSLALGVYSLASWNVSACGLLIGLVRSRADPTAPLDSVSLDFERAGVAGGRSAPRQAGSLTPMAGSP